MDPMKPLPVEESAQSRMWNAYGQHKEKTPRDPTVRARFNTYRFADHKEAMIDLLAKVVAVSLETVKITEAMRAIGGARRA